MGIVDISKKKITERVAIAKGRIYFGGEVWKVIEKGKTPKGDIFEIAKVSAIMAVKNTPNIIPHCHNILIEDIKINFSKNRNKSFIEVEVKVKARSKTGVEMESLTGCSVALLTIYDLLKFKGKNMEISNIELYYKKGGKSGVYRKN